MPNRDGTGPEGRGPLTGRGLGPCARGQGFRRGFGRDVWARYTEPVRFSRAEQRKILEEELKEIEREKEDIEKRLKEIEV